MSTAVQDRTTVEELQAILEDGAVCGYRQASFKTGEVFLECDKPATWAGTCRKCGGISLLCDEHYANLTRPDAWMMRCERCKYKSERFTDIYMFVHKI